MRAILFFDLFATTFLLFLGVGGFKRGFIKEIGRILSLVVTTWLSINYYVRLAEIIQQEINIDPYIALYTGFVIIFIITLIVTRIIVELIDQWVSYGKINWINQSLGFVTAVLKGTIPIALVLWALEVLPSTKWNDTIYDNSVVARSVKYIRDKNIEFLGWEDPVNRGKEYVRSLVVEEPAAQENDE